MSVSPKILLTMLGAIGASILFGLILGDLSVQESQIVTLTQARTGANGEEETAQRRHDTRFMASIGPGSHLPSIFLEIQYAYEVGITEIILETPIPWTPQQQTRLAQAIDGVKEIAEEITLSLALDCNPPQSWLRQNPDEASTTKVNGVMYPSVGSKKWREETQSRITELLTTLDSDIQGGRITGVVLYGLENGQWMRSGANDTSPAHEAAFRQWVSGRYANIETLRSAWNDPELDSLETIVLPDFTPQGPSQDVFLSPEKDRHKIDYNLFLSELTSAFIVDLATAIRSHTGAEFSILAAYPNLLEHANPAAGNWGIRALHDSAVDGVVTRLQSRHRQVGRHAYFASPIFSGRQTWSLDGTDTGIGYDPKARTITVPGTYIPSHVFNLMARNAVISALSGTTWVISDSSGAGAFAYKPLWKQLDTLLSIRDNILTASKTESAKLTIVIDENGSPFIKNASVYSSVLDSLVDTLTHSGISFTWTTLDALLSSEPDATPLYLFPNLYQISAETREQLHAVLGARQATVVWLYAPGYIEETADVANISALTGITTSLRDPAKKTGSKFVFSGTWIEENQDYGIERSIFPTFASVDEYADPLARYRDDESISAAMKYLDDGWTSIAIYEPTLTSELLRDLFYILEIPLDAAVMGSAENLIAYANSENILLYSARDTVANLEFDTNRDVLNVLNAKQGWSNSRTIAVELNAGETALLSMR